MSGIAIGSGPYGELVAIEWLQVVAGLPMFLTMFILFFAMTKRVTGQIDDEAVGSVGYMMMVVSGFSAVIYLTGLACIYTGLMWEGVFPHRLPQNLLASGGFFLMGLLVNSIPRIWNRLDRWLEDRRPRA